MTAHSRLLGLQGHQPQCLSPAARSLLGLDLPLNKRFYQQMMLIRLFEERLLELFSQGRIYGTTHTSMGQEANAVGILNAIDRDKDVVWSNHRCHGHFIVYSGEIVGLFAEIMGRVTGVCGGRGGSQHLCLRKFRSNGIQGGIAPAAVGSALANKDKGAISTVFLGDGTMGEGMVYEALNLAAVLNAPTLFVVEDNEIAQTTPKNLTVSGSIADRAQPFGIRSFAYDGANPLEIYAIAAEAINYVREKSRPAWLYLRTERLGPHSKGDDTRPAERIAQARARDPVKLFAELVDDPEAILNFCRSAIESALETASEGAVARGIAQ